MFGKSPFIVLAACLTGVLTANIQISPRVQGLLVGIGNKQILDCFVSNDQTVTVNELQWTYHSGVNVTENSQIDSTNITHSILTIGNFTREHVGTYNCTYTGASGEINKTSIKLSQVEESKIEGDFFFGNQSAIMLCTLRDFPSGAQPVFQEWRKNDKKLDTSNKFTNYGNGTLYITNPTRNDAGLYIARYNVTGEFGPYYDCEVAFQASALVLDMEKSKNLVEGDDLDLTCVIKGYPLSSVRWLKNGKLIVNDGNHVLKAKYNGIENSGLFIESVKISDGGNYTCEATGADGQRSSKSITIRIKDRLEWLWPVIGIICEAIVLGIIIFVCNKLKKKHHVD